MPNPNLEEIIKMLETGRTFSLTNSQYKKITGLDLPKDNSYLINKSAVAKRSKSKGYRLVVQERILIFEKEVDSDE